MTRASRKGEVKAPTVASKSMASFCKDSQSLDTAYKAIAMKHAYSIYGSNSGLGAALPCPLNSKPFFEWPSRSLLLTHSITTLLGIDHTLTCLQRY